MKPRGLEMRKKLNNLTAYNSSTSSKISLFKLGYFSILYALSIADSKWHQMNMISGSHILEMLQTEPNTQTIETPCSVIANSVLQCPIWLGRNFLSPLSTNIWEKRIYSPGKNHAKSTSEIFAKSWRTIEFHDSTLEIIGCMGFQPGCIDETLEHAYT